MKKSFIIPDLSQQIKIEENMFDYKLTITSVLPSNCSYIRSKKQKGEIVRYDSNIYRAKAKILDYAKNNIFNYFITITIDSKKYDASKFVEIRAIICKYFNNLKNRYDSTFKYILVAELGSKNNRLHFHGLVYLENKNILKHIKNGLYRDEKLFNTLGANQWKPIKEYNVQCALYCSKYIEKDNSATNLYNRYYFCSKGLKSSKNITYLFDENSLKDLFIYLSSCGLLHSGTYADTIVVDSQFLSDYLILKLDFEKNILKMEV